MTDLGTLAGLQAALDGSPFQAVLGIRVVKFDLAPPEIEFLLPFRPSLARQSGGEQIHGGVLATLMDVAGDYALALSLGYFTPTINLHTDFLRPAVGSLRAVATVLRCGRSIGVADIRVYDREEKLVATGRGTYSTRKS